MTLPAYMFKDPAIVLEEKQEREFGKSCVGCVNVLKIGFKGSAVHGVCNKGKLYGKRCILFKEIK